MIHNIYPDKVNSQKDIKLTYLITILVKMSNGRLFKALSSPTRIKIIKILLKKQIHVSGLARELDLSVPVISRHIKILENAGIIQKRTIGNVHLLSANSDILDLSALTFTEESSIEINEKENLFDALKQIPGIEIKKIGNNQYITSIDGNEGYFIYEIDGVPPKKPIDEYEPEKNVTVDLKKLIPVSKKRIKIKIKKKDKRS